MVLYLKLLLLSLSSERSIRSSSEAGNLPVSLFECTSSSCTRRRRRMRMSRRSFGQLWIVGELHQNNLKSSICVNLEFGGAFSVVTVMRMLFNMLSDLSAS